MRPVPHLPLSLLLLLSTVQPAGAQESLPSGWLDRSIELEAARLAATSPPLQQAAADRRVDETSSWARVVTLKPAFLMLVEVRGMPAVSRHFVWAGDAELIVINVDHPELSRGDRRTLVDAVSTYPNDFRRLDGGVRLVYGNIRLAPDGIFVGNRKIAETHEIVQRIPRQDVAAILTPPRRRYSAIGAVGGAVAGGVVGFYFAQRFAYSTRRDAGAWMAVSLVGLPIGGAVLGAHAGTGTTQRVIYRASP